MRKMCIFNFFYRRINSIGSSVLIVYFFVFFFLNTSLVQAEYERYAKGETAIIGEFVYDDDFVATTSACTVDIYNPSGTLIVNGGAMTADANGWHYYNYSVPSAGPEGVWPVNMNCGSALNGDLVKVDKSFLVGNTIVSTTTLATSIWNSAERTLTSFGSLVSNIWGNTTRTLTGASLDTGSLALQSDVITASTSLYATIPISVWNATNKTLSSFGTLASDVWNNGTRTLTEGSITASDVWSYATRRLSDATLDSGTLALSSEVSGVTTAVNANTNSQVLTASTSLGSAISAAQTAINSNTNSSISTASTSIGSMITSAQTAINSNTDSQVLTASTSLGSAISSAQTNINTNTNSQISSAISTINANTDSRVLTASTSLYATIPISVWNATDKTLSSFGTLASDVWNNGTRTLTSGAITSEPHWTMNLSDFGSINAGDDYLATLNIIHDSTLSDSSSLPTVTIYDPQRNVVVNGASMTRSSEGTYTYSYTTASNASEGTWQAVFSVIAEPGKTLSASDFWNLVSNPAQVIINSISDNTVPSVSANITITNEGLSGYEYQYEWCVVSDVNNSCGGGDDVFHSVAAKYINPQEDFNTTLTADVNTIGDYYFKVIVYFGTESSGASRSFSAVASPVENNDNGGSGGASSGGRSSTSAICGRKADFNCDAKVNSIDFSILMYFWRSKPPFSNKHVDINKDTKVDSVDFSILLYEWDKK